MNCILPIVFSVALIVLLVGGMTALAAVLEGAKNSDTLYGTTANNLICGAGEDTHIHGCRKVMTPQPSAMATTPQPAVATPTPWSDTLASPTWC